MKQTLNISEQHMSLTKIVNAGRNFNNILIMILMINLIILRQIRHQIYWLRSIQIQLKKIWNLKTLRFIQVPFH